MTTKPETTSTSYTVLIRAPVGDIPDETIKRIRAQLFNVESGERIITIEELRQLRRADEALIHGNRTFFDGVDTRCWHCHRIMR